MHSTVLPSFSSKLDSEAAMGVLGQIFDPFDLWDPFQDWFSDHTTTANTGVDWKETPEQHVIKADVPGMRKEDVKVEVEDGRVLRISGERKKEEGGEDDRWHRIERGVGKFFRRFRLPENAKMEQTKATMDDGVLTVTVPKEEVKKQLQEVKAIEIVG